MGTVYDMRRRQDPSHLRKDDSWLRRKIEMTRRWIFELGYLVQGAAVEAILKPQSLVPTRVRFVFSPSHVRASSDPAFRMLSPNFCPMGSTSSRCSSRISCMSLSWGSGRPYLHT